MNNQLTLEEIVKLVTKVDTWCNRDGGGYIAELKEPAIIIEISQDVYDTLFLFFDKTNVIVRTPSYNILANYSGYGLTLQNIYKIVEEKRKIKETLSEKKRQEEQDKEKSEIVPKIRELIKK